MEFRLLGPLEVCRDGERLVLGGPKQRAVLAILVLHANEVVPRGRLLADVWGERTPGSEHSLDVHISRLRKTLSSGGAESAVLIRRDRGYLLRVEAGSLDLVRFEQQIEAGERALAEGRPAEGARLLKEGLGLWRGEPLAEFSDEGFARAEAGRPRSAGWLRWRRGSTPTLSSGVRLRSQASSRRWCERIRSGSGSVLSSCWRCTGPACRARR